MTKMKPNKKGYFAFQAGHGILACLYLGRYEEVSH